MGTGETPPVDATDPGRFENTGPRTLHEAGGGLVTQLRRSIEEYIRRGMAKDLAAAAPDDFHFSLVRTVVRDFLSEDWLRTKREVNARDAKRVYYLSAEFLIGRFLDTGLTNLGLYEPARRAMRELGLELEQLIELEWDAALGAGGLGRLAACFLDSMATLGIPAIGYGLRYEYGMFRQKIEDGYQIEVPDSWLRHGNPWEVARPEHTYRIDFGGRVREVADAAGRTRAEWVDTQVVLATAYDTPIPGYLNGVVNTFRTWAARSPNEFDLKSFNRGDYVRAVQDQMTSENLCRVVYPKDDTAAGRELRLRQEYFLVSASLQDILRRYRKAHTGFDRFPEHAAIQLNDTHPAMAVPELMRLLVDREGMNWDEAWRITTATFGYTNHTIMPEALERWPVSLLGRLFPRHLQIIYEINRRFLSEVARKYPHDVERIRAVSLIEEGPEQQVRMANLAVVGSHMVNGVSAIHTNLLRRNLFRDFCELFPERFTNMTNGITPRLWLKQANPGLASLISSHIGDRWVTDLSRLERLEPLADDPAFRGEWARVKRENKRRLADYIASALSIRVSPDAMFECQVKRIHEYKRQLLNVLHTVALYNGLRDAPERATAPRVVVFGGKAAPGYETAKLIIKLINAVADTVNRDPTIGDRLKVIFLPDYRVSLARLIIPAADVSVQISTAGTEASGTSNMKLSLNGALTLGTLDGANVEIRDAVGDDLMAIFGLTAADVESLRHHYDPRTHYYAQPELRRALDMIRDGGFSPGQPGLFRPLVADLLDHGDPYFVLADFAAFAAARDRLTEWYTDPETWTRKAILTVARMGRFSSDRTILEYAREIWKVL